MGLEKNEPPPFPFFFTSHQQNNADEEKMQPLPSPANSFGGYFMNHDENVNSARTETDSPTQQLLDTLDTMEDESLLPHSNETEHLHQDQLGQTQKEQDEAADGESATGGGESATTRKCATLTSLDIFRSFVAIRDGRVDASGILGKECYDTWFKMRKGMLKNPHLTFVQTIRGHVSALPKVGRHPFEPDVEKSLLELLRMKKIWPCFTGTQTKYGIRGMKLVGYHERLEMERKTMKDDKDFDEAISILLPSPSNRENNIMQNQENRQQHSRKKKKYSNNLKLEPL